MRRGSRTALEVASAAGIASAAEVPARHRRRDGAGSKHVAMIRKDPPRHRPEDPS